MANDDDDNDNNEDTTIELNLQPFHKSTVQSDGAYRFTAEFVTQERSNPELGDPSNIVYRDDESPKNSMSACQSPLFYSN